MEAAVAGPPKITYAPWITPRTLAQWSPSSHADYLLVRLRVALEEYIDVACRPLASVPPSKRSALADEVVRYALAGTDARWRMVLALDELTGGDLKRFLLIGELVRGWLPDVRRRASGVFAPEQIGCLEMGIRVHLRALRHVIGALERGQGLRDELPENIGSFYELLHAGACLDLSVTTVLWYLDESPSRETAPIPEELCFLVKEFSLAQSALSRLVFPSRGRTGRCERTGSRQTDGAGAADRRWDREFCNLALPDLRKHLSKVA